MKRLIILTALVLGLFVGSLTPAAARQDPLLESATTCESCMHDTALWLGNKCEYAWSHCSPCYYVVDFWCSPAHALRLKLKL